jgi:hypothetical protein
MTAEGLRFFEAARQLGSWGSGGLGAARLNRAELRARVGGQMEPWVLDGLMDAFEPAAMASVKAAGKRRGAGGRNGDGDAAPEDKRPSLGRKGR